jgi:hypothetical protein
MDILTQYYNIDGQIIKTSPDLTTREFYRDTLCRHRFNEMFVAAREDEGMGYIVGYNSIVFSWNENYGALPFTTGYGPGSYQDISIITTKDGYNGRKAWTCPDDNICGIYTTELSNIFKNKTIEANFLVRFPNPSLAQTLIFEVVDVKPSQYGGYNEIFMCSIWANAGSTNINFNTGSSYSYLDNSKELGGTAWYTITAKTQEDGTSGLYLNGTLLASGTADRTSLDTADDLIVFLEIFDGTQVDSVTLEALS